MVEIFKGYSIQSDKQVNEIIDSEKHVDVKNWLRNDSAEQVGVKNDSEKLVVDESDRKSDPSVATHTTNRISATETTNGISTQKYIHCSSNQPSKLLSNPLPRSSLSGEGCERELDPVPDVSPAGEHKGQGAPFPDY